MKDLRFLAMRNRVQNLIMEIKAGLPLDKLAGLLSDQTQAVRGTALQSIVEHFKNDATIVHYLREFIDRPENRLPAMGTISLSHLGMKLLKSLEQSEAQQVFDALRRSWPEKDVPDLEWFLLHG